MIGPPTSVIIDRVLNGNLTPLIINLYPLERGYSLVFPASDGRKWTTRCFSYEDESELLDDVEQERLPLFLIDLIDRYCASTGSDTSPIFYEGCIGVEVRDFRRRTENTESASTETSGGNKYEVSYAVLRPTVSTLLNDLENLQYAFLCMEKQKEPEKPSERPNTAENAESIYSRRARYDHQRLVLESDFWRLVGSSCNRDPAVESKRLERSDRMAEWPYKRRLRYDLAARRRRETALCLEQHFPITNWIINNTIPGQRRSFVSCQSTEQSRSSTVTTPSAGASQWKPMLPTMVKTPMEIAEKKLQRAQMQQQEQQSESVDGMDLIEEYGIESSSSSKQKAKTRIRIYKRRLDSVYVGQLRMERDDGTATNSGEGSSEQADQESDVSECSFLLGSEAGSRSYIRQYLDMISEGGRKHLTLTRRVPGKPPQVMPAVMRGFDVSFNIPPVNSAMTPVIIPVQAVASTPGHSNVAPTVQSHQYMQYISARPRSSSQDNTEQATQAATIQNAQAANVYFSVD